MALALSGAGAAGLAVFHSVQIFKQIGFSVWNTSTGETMIALPDEKKSFSARERMQSLFQLLPIAFLMLLIIFSMYGGYASPTEAAGVGVLGSCIISLIQRSMTWQGMKSALMSAARASSMVGLIVIGAVFLSQAMALLGIPTLLANNIAAMNLSPLALVCVLLVFYMFLGCIMEGMSTIVMTLPITLPLILHAGYDKIWFGVFLVLVVEMAQITPPVGFNLFVIQGLTGERIGAISRATMPFFIIMALFTILIAVFPEIVTYLPETIKLTG